MRKFLISSFILLNMVIQNCSVSPILIYRLKPTSEKTDWFWGREYQKIKNNDFEIILAFIEQYQDYLVFDFSIANNSNGPVFIKPEEIYYISKVVDDKNNFINVIDTIWAINPEEKLLEIDKIHSINETHYAAASAYSVLGSVFDLTYDLCTITEKKSDEELEKEELENQSDEITNLQRDIDHDNTIKDLTNEKALWSNKAIRKTTLYPKYSIHGYIFFPISKEANFISVNIPIENNIITIDYHQEKHDPMDLSALSTTLQ